MTGIDQTDVFMGNKKEIRDHVIVENRFQVRILCLYLYRQAL